MLPLVTKIFVTSGRTSEAQNISTFKRMTSKKLTTNINNNINNFLLTDQKLCVNVTIIKFELV